jgi:sec-independent protein translocase protein TatA
VARLALEGWELIIVGIIAVVVILWGPAKIPEFARALGRAKGEFEKASQEFTTANQTATQTPAANSASSSDDLLIQTARKLGIKTEGKTREEISADIIEKAKAADAA